MRNNDIDFAKICFESKHYDKAKEIFLNNNMLYEAGLCSLLLGNIQSTKLIWDEEKTEDPAISWGFIMLDIIEKKPRAKMPGYFQTRAFLEVYINLLLLNEHYDWVDNIINAYKFFTKANGEAPKFIARVLSAWGYNTLVHEFSRFAKKVCYYDPEIHFIEAETYFSEENYTASLEALNETLRIAPKYFPAEKLKEIVLNYSVQN